MPLLDHFRPPVDDESGWNSFHSNWATRIADQIAYLLPDEFRVEEYAKMAGGVEIDVAAVGDEARDDPELGMLASDWQPPPPAATAPAVFPDKFEVLVFRTPGGRQLVGAIELVSPGNKDRPEEREAFVSKVAAYLQQGASVVVIDVVTTRRANLHNEIVRRLEMPAELAGADGTPYAAAYRPVMRDGRAEIDVWVTAFAVGDPLPTMPLRLIAEYFVPVDFEAAYTEARRRRKLD